MRTYQSDTYFNTQSEALNHVFASIPSKYQIQFPENIWTEHVSYGTTVRYSLPLIVSKTGNPAKKWLHISLYRMDSGKYELTYYKS
jgi:hypothetical protein